MESREGTLMDVQGQQEVLEVVLLFLVQEMD
jgi:hypothetical protein